MIVSSTSSLASMFIQELQMLVITGLISIPIEAQMKKKGIQHGFRLKTTLGWSSMILMSQTTSLSSWMMMLAVMQKSKWVVALAVLEASTGAVNMANQHICFSMKEERRKT